MNKQQKKELLDEQEYYTMLTNITPEDSLKYFNKILLEKAKKDSQDLKSQNEMVSLDEYTAYVLLDQFKKP